MLLDDFIDVKINSYNLKYYKNLGYEIPMRMGSKGKLVYDIGKTIRASINDVQLHSNIKVNVDCDCCKKKYQITYNDYNSRTNENGIYCLKCKSKVFFSGEKSPHWNFNKTNEERENGRSYPEYVEFVKRVLARDNYTCQCCGKSIPNDIAVHHLDSYDWCVEKRIDDTNGITLCNTCHKNFHSQYGYGNNSKKQFEIWFGKTIELIKNNCNISPTRQIYCIEDDKIYDGALSLMRYLGLKSPQFIYNTCNHKKGIHINQNGERQEYPQNTIKDKHYLWLDEYRTMTQEQINDFLKNTPRYKKCVICVTTGKIFDSIKKAGDYYNTTPSHISSCCRNKRKTAGKHPITNESLVWNYY